MMRFQVVLSVALLFTQFMSHSASAAPLIGSYVQGVGDSREFILKDRDLQKLGTKAYRLVQRYEESLQYMIDNAKILKRLGRVAGINAKGSEKVTQPGVLHQQLTASELIVKEDRELDRITAQLDRMGVRVMPSPAFGGVGEYIAKARALMKQPKLVARARRVADRAIEVRNLVPVERRGSEFEMLMRQNSKVAEALRDVSRAIPGVATAAIATTFAMKYLHPDRLEAPVTAHFETSEAK